MDAPTLPAPKSAKDRLRKIIINEMACATNAQDRMKFSKLLDCLNRPGQTLPKVRPDYRAEQGTRRDIMHAKIVQALTLWHGHRPPSMLEEVLVKIERAFAGQGTITGEVGAGYDFVFPKE